LRVISQEVPSVRQGRIWRWPEEVVRRKSSKEWGRRIISFETFKFSRF